jgi:hypothetical protein
MARTPEGKVKEDIKILLREYFVYYLMPVQTGYGSACVDFHCSLPGGLSFFIEAKQPDGELKPRQAAFLRDRQAMGIQTFVVADEHDVRRVRRWLEVNSLVSLKIPMVKMT